MNIYTIIVTFNGINWINKCLDSVYRSTIPLKVILIDNGSEDDTLNIISNEYPDICLIKSSKNIGFGKANNIGIKIAIENNADYIVLLNQDAWIESDTIEIILELSKKNQDFGILSCLHVDAAREELDYNFSLQLSPDRCPLILSDIMLGLRKEIYETKFVNAAFWFITRECIDRVGLFDPLFYMYGEDDNYIQRVKFNNLKIGITPRTTICHDRKYRERTSHIEFNWIRTDFLKYILNPNNIFLPSYLNGLIRVLGKSLILLLNLKIYEAVKTINFFIVSIIKMKIFYKTRNSYLSKKSLSK